MSISNAARGTAYTLVASLGFLTLVGGAAMAQDSSPRTAQLEFRVPAGLLVGTGGQRRHVKNAQVTAAQLSWVVRPQFAITGTFGWARSRDVSRPDAPKLDVFTTDLGVETRSGEWFGGRRMSASVFAGLGAGVRSYNYRKLDVEATNNVAGYAALGSEIGMGRVGMRVEARNYLSAYRPLAGVGQSDNRNDIVIMGALSLNRQ